MDSKAVVLSPAVAQKLGDTVRRRMVGTGVAIIVIGLLIGLGFVYRELAQLGFTFKGAFSQAITWLTAPIQGPRLLSAVGLTFILQVALSAICVVPGLRGQETTPSRQLAVLAGVVLALWTWETVELLREVSGLLGADGTLVLVIVVMFISFVGVCGGIATGVRLVDDHRDLYGIAQQEVRAFSLMAMTAVAIFGAVFAAMTGGVAWLIPLSGLVAAVIAIGCMSAENSVAVAHERIASITEKTRPYIGRSVVLLQDWDPKQGSRLLAGSYLDVLGIDPLEEVMHVRTHANVTVALPVALLYAIRRAEPGYAAEGPPGESLVGTLMQFRTSFEELGISKGQFCDIIAYDGKRECYTVRPTGADSDYEIHWTFLRGHLEPATKAPVSPDTPTA